MANYPQTTEAAVTRDALDASTEAARQVVVLIAENARLRAEVAALRARCARYEAALSGRRPWSAWRCWSG